MLLADFNSALEMGLICGLIGGAIGALVGVIKWLAGGGKKRPSQPTGSGSAHSDPARTEEEARK